MARLSIDAAGYAPAGVAPLIAIKQGPRLQMAVDGHNQGSDAVHRLSLP
jgi:hypothetical protein